MREVQASDAKVHLPQLLDDVEHGETILITRHGRAIARIAPEKNHRQEEIDKAIASIKSLRRRTGRLTRLRGLGVFSMPRPLSINGLARKVCTTAGGWGRWLWRSAVVAVVATGA
jgi:prevent-host-death family protein